MPEAIALLQRGDLASAEHVLRSELTARPNDVEALDVLGIVLDQEKKYGDADAIYQRALVLSPHSSSLLNNYGNHLLTEGKRDQARTAYTEVLALDPANVNACEQVARIAIDQKTDPHTACLDRLPAAQSQTDVSILRMQAAYLAGHKTQADALLGPLTHIAQTDAQLSFNIGVALSAVQEYAAAETLFDHSLKLAPENFEALYDLGLAASHAHHPERAREALTQALDRQPENVDVLYDLAAVNVTLDQKDAALQLLARAAQLAPERADVERLIAYTSSDLGDFADAVQAWNRYLALVPHDEVARREHAFAVAAFGEHANEGVADLRIYVRANPNDPIGHYELGTAESSSNPDQALKELGRALALKPDLTAAHVARGLISYRQGNAAAALPDFEVAARQEPQNARVLDRLGETYSALDRPADALRVFHEAAALSPRDSGILLHLARALTKAGKTEQAHAMFARFRELGPDTSALPHPAGLVNFLNLSPKEQYARYRAGVERTIQHSPGNAEAQVRYLEVLLNDGNTVEAAAVASQILNLKPSAALLADAASELLSAEQYSLAANFLKQAICVPAASEDLKLDQALATFHVADPHAALEQLDALPQATRNGDFYLARMQILEALNDPAQAAAAFRQALSAKPTRPELYRQVALVLIKNHRSDDAERLLELGARVLLNDADIPLLRAAAAESNANNPDSQRLLTSFAARWPESARLWSQN